ncbi:MFS transporter [Mangrovactinospora gilvigrisea]|uniref:MFS transporter n=1 Tax=Mangrovactinospora gilvigrisea TaxID=1428644 RepID=A0A1J7BG86_9ACTN|nr:MFS transporter [Mangrovactinospora gilvigrisea]OIV37687.1 MFS transporter [Mangrovactinospora gilvigrisea]
MTTQTTTSDAVDAPASAIRPPGVEARLGLRAKLVLAVLCAAQFAIALDFSILNVALPSLGRDLGFSAGALQWGITAFALASGGFLLLGGRIADLVGRRKVFLVGMAALTLASVLAAAAWSPEVFLAARVLQGLAAAGVVPSGMALLTAAFPEGPLRERALGVSGTIMATGFTTGMVLGGVLTEALSWRSTMALIVVMGVVVTAVAPRLLTESRNPHHSRLDVPGALAVTGAVLALIYGLTAGADGGFGRPQAWGSLAAGVVLLAVFGLVESRSAEPMVDLKLLRRRSVLFGNLGGFTAFSLMSSVFFLLTLFLQDAQHISPLVTGLVFGVPGAAAAVSGALAPRLVGRYGPRKVLVAGLLVQGVATAPLIALGAAEAAGGRAGVLVLVLVGTSLACVGHLWAIPSYGVVATSGLTPEQQGLGASLVTLTQQMGMTVGTPVLSAVAAAAGGTAGVVHGVPAGLAVDAAAVLLLAAAVWTALARRARP